VAFDGYIRFKPAVHFSHKRFTYKRIPSMKLTYRRQTYEAPAPIQLAPAAADQPKMKLIYRGHICDYTPRPVVVPEASVMKGTEGTTEGETVTLIYRGHTYQRNLRPLQPYQQPRAINWRWQPTDAS
jgi:hypothetical protein